jgi:hypothetical protein
MLLVINIGVAPAARAQHLNIFAVGIDDGFAVQLVARIRQLSSCVLRICEIVKVVIPPQQRCQMCKTGTYLSP